MIQSLENIREFYHRLNHKDYGVTELAVIDPTGEKGVIATGFFNDENAFVKACQEYNGRYNIYAGRNPRPRWLPIVFENYLDVRVKQRANDKEIEYLTAISLDLDPIRAKGTSSTELQHETAIYIARRMQKELGGCVDDSGNGAYLWISFAEPIKLTDENRVIIKQKCQQWQKQVVEKYHPEGFGLKIDGCFDFSRLKKVIGTLSVKGKTHRLSKFVVKSPPSNTIRDVILGMPVHVAPADDILSQRDFSISQSLSLPSQFLQLLQTNPLIKQLWKTPNEENDTSKHDWELGCACVQAGITNPTELAVILMNNPFGKFKRDRRQDYLQTTVNKLVMENANALHTPQN